MDGEAGWWTTSGKIGLPPLARVMGVGRQQQQYCYEEEVQPYRIILQFLPERMGSRLVELHSVVFCTRVGWACLVGLLLYKEAGSSPVYL